LIAERFAVGNDDALSICALDILAEIGDEKSLVVLQNLGCVPRVDAVREEAIKMLKAKLGKGSFGAKGDTHNR
jgi:hypothetical protein